MTLPSAASTTGMKGGGFYDAHSEYQQRVILAGEAGIRHAVATLALDGIGGALTIADYGAGTGATSVLAVHAAIRAIRERGVTRPIVAVHNDLPTSDFSSLFGFAAAPGGYLAEPGPIYSTAAAGSFFGQVVADGSVHLGLCSNAAHWFREQPDVGPVDGMYFSAATGKAGERLAAEAAEDWCRFLGTRAAELAPGGQLLVQGIATDGSRVSAAGLLDQMWRVCRDLVHEELLDSETLAHYVFPVYCRSEEEVAAPLEPGGALATRLTLVSSKLEEVPNPYWEQFERDGDAQAYARTYSDFVRAFSEANLTRDLFSPGARGIEPGQLCTEFFDRFEQVTGARPDAGRYRAYVMSSVFLRR